MSRVLGSVLIGGHLHTVTDPDAPTPHILPRPLRGVGAASLSPAGDVPTTPAGDTNRKARA